jgi:hypothetical protein
MSSDRLRVPQARVLKALMPDKDVADRPEYKCDWPTYTRATLSVMAGYTGTSGSITRALNGIRAGNRTSGAPHPGLLERGLIEELVFDIDGVLEDNYRITFAGIAAYRAHLAANGGKLPPVKDAAFCTNDRYLQQGAVLAE